jgi:hypothetical protein
MDRHLVFRATVFVCIGLTVSALSLGISLLLPDLFVIPALSFLFAWLAVVYLEDLRIVSAARASGAPAANSKGADDLTFWCVAFTWAAA